MWIYRHFATHHIDGLDSASKCCAVSSRQTHQQIFIGKVSERTALIGLSHRINRPECSADIHILGHIRQRLEVPIDCSDGGASIFKFFSPLAILKEASVFLAVGIVS